MQTESVYWCVVVKSEKIFQRVLSFLYDLASSQAWKKISMMHYESFKSKGKSLMYWTVMGNYFVIFECDKNLSYEFLICLHICKEVHVCTWKVFSGWVQKRFWRILEVFKEVFFVLIFRQFIECVISKAIFRTRLTKLKQQKYQNFSSSLVWTLRKNNWQPNLDQFFCIHTKLLKTLNFPHYKVLIDIPLRSNLFNSFSSFKDNTIVQTLLQTWTFKL